MSARADDRRTASADHDGDRGHERARLAAVLEGRSAAAPSARLAQLAGRFGLSPLETDIVALLWVATFEVKAPAETFGGQVTVQSAAALLGHPARARLFSESPLLLWRMVREHELIDGNAVLALDAGILGWLEGADELDRALAGRAQLLPVGGESADWPLDAIARQLHESLRQGRSARLHVASDDALAARWFSAALGLRLGLPVLNVPAGALAGDPEAAIRLHRQAFLDGCIPCLAAEDAELSRPPGVGPYPAQIVCGGGRLPEAPPQVRALTCRLPAPGPAERERLWRRLWPECAGWPAGAVADLALCHEAGVEDIAAAAATAPADADSAALALRERARDGAGPLARRIDAAFTWDDLVLPPATRERLEEITFEARERLRVWADPTAARLFPYGRGLVALLAGPPGAGKTMAAQVIAADLGLDLLAVDLSAVVSKWVGETAQHIQQLLSSRAAQRSVLFFDEADALFAKRVEEVRDAQDRFANLDTSHLMTALESYPGVVLLASNLKANIDTAFLRRMRHLVDFAKPGPEAREQIWRKAVAALFPRAEARRLDKDLARVARIEATGGLIKNAALSALFASRRSGARPTARLLGEMLARELAKEGAALSGTELDSLLEGAP
ncbi:MAG TPA: ATP-binding protein [Reyranella sp.]|nr:ATP-binding protein [Reyranella sp.]